MKILKAQFVYENMDFERGKDPKDSLSIGDKEFRDFLNLSNEDLINEFILDEWMSKEKRGKIILALMKKNKGTRKEGWEKKIEDVLIARSEKLDYKAKQILKVMREFAKKYKKRLKKDDSDPEYFYAGVNDSYNEYFLSIGLNPADDNKFHLARTDLHSPQGDRKETDTIEEAMEWIEDRF